MRWIQKAYEEMEEVDKEAKDQKTTLQDLLFEGSSTGVGPDISSSEQQKKPPGPTNKSNRYHRM